MSVFDESEHNDATYLKWKSLHEEYQSKLNKYIDKLKETEEQLKKFIE